MLLKNATTGGVIATEVRLVDRPLERLTGFLNRDEVSPNEGLWFRRCCAVHTFGLRMRVDFIFLDEQDRVVRTAPNVSQNRVKITCPQASSVIELGGGALERCDLLIGDRVILE
jgi:uncharacterized membrane protein (UPF0127 family)